MKKVLIVAVCIALVLTLAFTLGALGKKPDKPGKLEYVIHFTEDVEGTVEHCVTQGRFISSSSEDEYRPTLTLNSVTFVNPVTLVNYGGEHDGQYLDLSKQQSEITMQFFFFFSKDPDTIEKEKVQLIVDGGTVLGGEEKWLSEEFTIVFNDPDAVINPTKGKRDPLWGPGNVEITVVCQPPQD